MAPPNITKVYANKSFQQRSSVTPKSTSSQTNRAVELRRARAQAKIEELAKRTKKQFYKPKQPMDVMSTSWHSHATNTNLRTRIKTKPVSQKEDLSTTRTISSSSCQRSLSGSSIPVEEQHDQKRIVSAYSIEEVSTDNFIHNESIDNVS
jgi:hypothetical protein